MKVLLKKWDVSSPNNTWIKYCCWNLHGQLSSHFRQQFSSQFCAPTNFSKDHNLENHCLDKEFSNTTRIHALVRNACFQCFDKKKPLRHDEEIRNRIRINLQNYLQKFSSTPVAVEAFGSTVNGFGSYDADLDFYVNGMKMHNVKNHMQRSGQFSRIRVIRSRISLIKFRHSRSGLEGDISFENQIALENSKLLRRYSTISKRCRVLVFAMKYLAKCCHIADTWNNFISSYAYTLMVIYYLQQLKDPILPVLQELKPPDVSEEDIKSHTINNFQTYFYTGDNHSLRELWPESTANVQSIGELFLGLLKFYAFEFDFLNDVVCIHRKAPSPLEIKQMNPGKSGLLRIQDPFELKRNLGGMLLPRTNQIIKSVFCNAYNHFSKLPADEVDTSKLLNYFFDSRVLLGDSTEQKNGRFEEKRT